MNWIFDIVVALFCILVVVTYIRKGGKTIFHIITPVLSFGAAYFFGGRVGTALFGNAMLKIVTEATEKKLSEMVVYTEGTFNISQLFESLPEAFVAFMDRIGASVESVQEVFGEITHGTNEELTALAEMIAQKTAQTLAVVIGCILVFVAVRVILYFIAKIYASVAKLPLIKQLDGALGIIPGVISAFAYTWLICTALSFVVEYGLFTQHSDLLLTIAEKSIIYRLFAYL